MNKEDKDMSKEMSKGMEMAREYITQFYGAEDTEQWLNANEGEEEMVMAMTINQWQEELEDGDCEGAEPIPTEILEWARSITDAKR